MQRLQGSYLIPDFQYRLTSSGDPDYGIRGEILSD